MISIFYTNFTVETVLLLWHCYLFSHLFFCFSCIHVCILIELALMPRPYVFGYFESATFSFRTRLPSTRIRRIRQRIRIFLNPLSRGQKMRYICNESDNGCAANPDIFESDNIAKSCPVSYRTINQYGGTTTCRPSFSRVSSDTIGCVWTGDWITLRVDKESFESGNKQLRIQKKPNTFWRGLSS